MSETVCHKFLETVRKSPENTSIMYKRGGRWNELTWAGYSEFVQTIAAGLQTLGIRKGDRVAINSNTRYEWAAADLAILGLGGVTVPIYPSSSPEDIAYVLEDSEAKILICETDFMVQKLTPEQMKALAYVIVIDRKVSQTDGEAALENSQKIISLTELQFKGEIALKKSPTLYELAVRELANETPATIVYTSGTTGRPRGVLHTHTQLLSEVTDAFPLLGVTPRDRSLTFLPFAHVLGRIEIWGHVLIGYTMAFAQSIERIKDDLIDVQPTLMVAVPRIFEKVYNSILAQAEISPIKKRVFEWAFEIGREISRYKIEKQAVPIDLSLKYQAARQLVFNTIRDRMGGKLRFAVCGGAPLSRPIAEFFHAAGLLILEGYGLTETLAAITVNTPFDYRFGTVGKAIGDVRLKIADDGEILVQSKKVMKGYYKDSETTDTAMADGWFHTGDIGQLSPEGFLTITDRKKELIKTAGGKYVAPQRLEGYLKTDPLISQVLIHGDQRKFIVALLTLNSESVEKYAKDHGISYKDPASLLTQPKVKELVRNSVAQANSHLASFESIKNFAILPKDFSVETGELTPSLKVKRKVVESKYRDVLDQLYGGAADNSHEARV